MAAGRKVRDIWKSNKRVRVLIRVLMSICILFFVGVFILSIYLNNLVNSRLKEIVRESSDSLYNLKYSKVRVNALTGHLTVYDAELIPDTAVFLKMWRNHQAPRFLVGGKVSRLIADNVHSITYLTSKKLKVGQVIIDNPQFRLIQYTLEKDTVHDASGIYQLLSKQVKGPAGRPLRYKERHHPIPGNRYRRVHAHHQQDRAPGPWIYASAFCWKKRQRAVFSRRRLLHQAERL